MTIGFGGLQKLFGTEYSKMGQVKYMEDSLKEIWSDMVCFKRSYHFNFLKVSLPKSLPDLFLNTSLHLPDG